MTIEFESHGSRMLAVSALNGANRISIFNDEKPYVSYFIEFESYRVCLPIGKYEFLGLSIDHPEHHGAMKEAAIYHENQMGPKPSINWNSENMTKRQSRMIDEWNELNKRVSECWILLKIKG